MMQSSNKSISIENSPENKNNNNKKLKLSDILENIDPLFCDFEVIFFQEGIKTEEKIRKLTDKDLKRFGVKPHPLTLWRKVIQYAEGSWQRKLYDMN
eukprot:UN12963